MLRRTFLKSLLLVTSIPVLANINTTIGTALTASQILKLVVKHQNDSDILLVLHDKLYELPNHENTYAALKALRITHVNAYMNLAAASTHSKYGHKAVFSRSVHMPLSEQVWNKTAPTSYYTAETQYKQLLQQG